MSGSFTEISTQMVARSFLLSEQLEGASVYQELMVAVMLLVDAYRRKIDSTLWTDTSPNLTNTSGDNTETMTLSRFVQFVLEGKALWKNTMMGTMTRMFMHPNVISQLATDLTDSNNALLGSAFGPQATGAALAQTSNQGPQGRLIGVDIFDTERIPVADVSGFGNVLCLVNNGAQGEQNSCFGLAVKRSGRAEVRGTEQKLAQRAIGSVDFGIGILRQDYGLQCITSQAAA